MRSSYLTLSAVDQLFTKRQNARQHSYIAVAHSNEGPRPYILAPVSQRQRGILCDSQKRFSEEIEQELESDGCDPSDNFEFGRGAMIAAAIGVAMWAVVFLIVKLVFS